MDWSWVGLGPVRVWSLAGRGDRETAMAMKLNSLGVGCVGLGCAVLCCAVLSRSRAALELERKSRKEEEQKEHINPKGRTAKKRIGNGKECRRKGGRQQERKDRKGGMDRTIQGRKKERHQRRRGRKKDRKEKIEKETRERGRPERQGEQDRERMIWFCAESMCFCL